MSIKTQRELIIPDSLLSAENITYNNTSSGLQSETIQGAVDELAAEIPDGIIYVDAEETPDIGDIKDVTSAKFVSYNNTDSNLEATNVQDAIDEINELKVNKSDIVDNLESTATDLPISANQVRLVNDKVDDYIRENLLTYPFHDTTLSTNGITFTDNGDGTITVNGTNTSANIVDYAIAVRLGAVGVTAKNPTILPAGTYTLSGCPEGGSDSTYCLRTGTDDANLNYKDFGKDYGQGITFTTDGESQIGVFIYIAAGVTVNNLTFKPMLEVGTVAHEYKPYSLNRLTKGDIVDNLLSNRVDLPLSANQGNKLSNMIVIKTVSIPFTPIKIQSADANANTWEYKLPLISPTNGMVTNVSWYMQQIIVTAEEILSQTGLEISKVIGVKTVSPVHNNGGGGFSKMLNGYQVHSTSLHISLLAQNNENPMDWSSGYRIDLVMLNL